MTTTTTSTLPTFRVETDGDPFTTKVWMTPPDGDEIEITDSVTRLEKKEGLSAVHVELIGHSDLPVAESWVVDANAR